VQTGVSPGRWRASGAKGCVLSYLDPSGAGRPRYATLVRDPGWPSRCAALASRLAVRGRSFGGWHHVTLVAVAHGFLTLERLRRPKPAASA
jgi:hypothetical protein